MSMTFPHPSGPPFATYVPNIDKVLAVSKICSLKWNLWHSDGSKGCISGIIPVFLGQKITQFLFTQSMCDVWIKLSKVGKLLSRLWVLS